MKNKKYESRINRLKENKTAYKILKVVYTLLPAVMFAMYPIMLIVKAFTDLGSEFWLMVCVPAATLITVTILRKLINRPRPYEKYDHHPLFRRDGTGESFPSRHTASAFIIAMSGFVLNPYLAIGLLILSAIIGFSRVLAGVHFFTDVLAGAIISLVIGTVFFILI